MIVEVIIQRADIEVYIGVSLCESLDAFGGRDDAEEVQFLAAVLLEKINCCQSGAACREHGIYGPDLL